MVHHRTRVWMCAIFWTEPFHSDGPIRYPPRSPDVTSLNFLWDFVKDRFYATPISDVAELRRKITNVICTITSDMLNSTWAEIEYRLDILSATNGAYVEVCLVKLFELLYRTPKTTWSHQSEIPPKLMC